MSSPTFDKSDQSGSSRLRELYETALEDYKQQTDIDLAKDPLTERIKGCSTVESITDILREKAQDFRKFREKDKVLKPLRKVLNILHKLSPLAIFGQGVGWVCS
jgi:hypothetical protein